MGFPTQRARPDPRSGRRTLYWIGRGRKDRPFEEWGVLNRVSRGETSRTSDLWTRWSGSQGKRSEPPNTVKVSERYRWYRYVHVQTVGGGIRDSRFPRPYPRPNKSGIVVVGLGPSARHIHTLSK